MITFVTLWKVKKMQEAGEYLETAANLLNKVIAGVVESRMSKNSMQNLYCLVVMSLAGLKVKCENDLEGAIKACQECKLQLDNNALCEKMLTAFEMKLEGVENSENDFLIDELYQKVLFVTAFMPLISHNTPLIAVAELEQEKEKVLNFAEDLSSNNSHQGIVSKERINSSRGSRREFKSTPRPRRMTKPWWESNKMLDFSVNSNKSRESRLGKGFKSEPRQYKKPPIYPDTHYKFSPAILAAKVARPISRESFVTDYSHREKESRGKVVQNDRDLIMFEFNPSLEQANGEYQVQLVPLAMAKGRNAGIRERPLANFHISRPVS
jgi:hypothetical protein